MNDAEPLIILSDYGLDDACALAYLLRAASYRQIDVVCVAGNAPSDAALCNAQKLLNALERHDWKDGTEKKLRLIDTADIFQKCAQLESVHGKDGLGDIFLKPCKIHAVAYTKWIQELPASATVLSLGPATVALDVVRRITKATLVAMAGRVSAEPNHLGMEFNESLDPESFDMLVRFEHKIATLDTCRAEGFNTSGLRLKGKGLMQTVVNRTIALAEKRHADRCYIYDLIAALYLVIPEIFTTRSVRDARGNLLSELSLNRTDFSLSAYLEEFVRGKKE